MDTTISSELNFSLTLFFIITAGVIGFSGFFLVKIFLEVSQLVGSLQKFMEIVNHEFQPTLIELQNTLQHINSITGKADKHLTQFSESLDTAGVKTSSVMTKAKINLASIMAGIGESVRKLMNNSKQ